MLAENYHFIAIGGIGMSALARILLDRGAIVTGSDVSHSYITKGLENAGVKITIGHRAENVPPSAVVVYSTAITSDNPEIVHAKKNNHTLIHRAILLADVMQSHAPLLVAGTHGKTTTSSLLTHVLVQAGVSPSFAVGGLVHSIGKNGAGGTGPYFVAEACESDGTFLLYPGFGGIITNIDKDHLDYWKEIPALIQGFRSFAANIRSKNHLFICADDPFLREADIQARSYGFDSSSDVRILNFHQLGWKIVMDLDIEGILYPAIEVPLVGRHNALNSAAVFALVLSLGIAESRIREAFLSFKGIGRRLEKKGERNGVEIYDDYGHHPTEIATTLEAVRALLQGRRLVVAFQPHRYTRTRDCLEEFGSAFQAADVLYITDIYSAGEVPIPGIDASTLLERVQKVNFYSKLYTSPRKEIVQRLHQELQPGDILVTLGAGDITKVGGEVLDLWV